MKKNALKITLIAVMILSMVLPMNFAFAEDTEVKNANAKFEQSAGDENGIYTVSMTISDATFMGFQVALKYNNKVAEPVSEDGKTAEDFDDFSTHPKWLNTVGTTLDNEKGYIGFTGYIMPGTEEENISEKGEYTTDENGVEVFTFRFKVIGLGGDLGLELATKEKGEPFDHAKTTGFYIKSYNNKYDVKVEFDTAEVAREEEAKYVEPVVSNKEMTRDERISDTIFMQIGKPKAITFGKIINIDDANEAVVPYIKNDRTMVPIRFISEKLGAEVVYKDGADGFEINYNGTNIELSFGSKEYKINGKNYTADTEIEVVEDRTMVPVRFISEALGKNVYWDETNEAVIITPLETSWEPNRAIEKQVLDEMAFSLSPLMKYLTGDK